MTAVTCMVSTTPHLLLLLHNTHIKAFKRLRKRKPFGHCFNLTKKKHAGPWSFNLINIIDHICAPRGNKPPPCCLLDSRGMHHFLGHCLFPSPLLGPRLTPNIHTYTHTPQSLRWQDGQGMLGVAQMSGLIEYSRVVVIWQRGSTRRKEKETSG